MDMYVCKEEFKRYSLDARFGELSFEEIDDYYEYLDGKKILDGNRNAQHAFLSQITTKFGFSPFYPSETQEYIESSLFSSKMKRCILNIIKGQKEHSNLIKTLELDTNINDFNTENLQEIGKALEENEEFMVLFDRYMFALDGEGPRTYIMLKYQPKELAHKILSISNIDPSGMVKDDEMLHEFIQFISLMYKRYLPKHRRSYLKFISPNDFENQSEFCQKYTEFVDSDFGKKQKNSFESTSFNGRAKNLVPTKYTMNSGFHRQAI